MCCSIYTAMLAANVLDAVHMLLLKTEKKHSAAQSSSLVEAFLALVQSFSLGVHHILL